MNPSELFTVAALVAALLAISGTFGWLQVRNLKRLQTVPQMPRDEFHFERTKSYRRLVGCMLMVLLAFLMGGAYFMGIEDHVLEIVRAKKAGEDLTADQQHFISLYSAYWSLVLLILMCMLFLAAADLWAIRRFGLKQYRKIQEDRRAMVERQAAAMRADRNGHGS